MLDILHQAQENDVAVSGLWIQDWSGKITTEFGTRFYKMLSTKIRLLKCPVDILVNINIKMKLIIHIDLAKISSKVQVLREGRKFLIKCSGYIDVKETGRF